MYWHKLGNLFQFELDNLLVTSVTKGDQSAKTIMNQSTQKLACGGPYHIETSLLICRAN